MNKIKKLGVSVGILVLMTAVLTLNAALHAKFSLWILYFVPIALSTWIYGAISGCVMTLVATAASIGLGLYLGTHFTSMSYFLMAVFSRSLAFTIVVWLIARLRQKEVERLFIPHRERTPL